MADDLCRRKRELIDEIRFASGLIKPAGLPLLAAYGSLFAFGDLHYIPVHSAQLLKWGGRKAFINQELLITY